MLSIPARAVVPGMTIQAPAVEDTLPVTFTVSEGGWSDADYAEPADPQHPTHVYLGGALPESPEVILPVDTPVEVLNAVVAGDTYCDSRGEHEVRLITDGTRAYAYGSNTDAGPVYLSAAREGTAYAGTCGQPLPNGESCEGDVRWVFTAADWNTATPEDRRHLEQYGTEVQDR